MDIYFSSNKLKKQLNQHREMVKAFGQIQAKKLKVVLAALAAAPTLETFAPQNSRPHRCHELTGSLKGTLSLDLEHPYRLLFVPDHDPLPIREEGGLDWNQVTSIIITRVKDTHG